MFENKRVSVPIVASWSAALDMELSRQLVGAALFAGPILLIVAVWEMLARAGLLDPLFYPAPSQIVGQALDLLTAPGKYVLWTHLALSAYRALGGFVIAAVSGVLLGLAIGVNRAIHDAVSPILSLLLPVPAVAWTPIFLIAVGRGDGTILAIVVLAALFPILYNTATGVRSVSSHQIWALQSMGATPLQVFRYGLLPGALPAILAGLKLGMAHAWRTLVAVEMMAAVSYGLGYMIFAARQWMNTSVMYVGIILLTLAGFSIEHLVFRTIERATVDKWYGSGR